MIEGANEKQVYEPNGPCVDPCQKSPLPPQSENRPIEPTHRF
jgi:hypothetical protein